VVGVAKPTGIFSRTVDANSVLLDSRILELRVNLIRVARGLAVFYKIRRNRPFAPREHIRQRLKGCVWLFPKGLVCAQFDKRGDSALGKVLEFQLH